MDVLLCNGWWTAEGVEQIEVHKSRGFIHDATHTRSPLGNTVHHFGPVGATQASEATFDGASVIGRGGLMDCHPTICFFFSPALSFFPLTLFAVRPATGHADSITGRITCYRRLFLTHCKKKLI